MLSEGFDVQQLPKQEREVFKSTDSHWFIFRCIRSINKIVQAFLDVLCLVFFEHHTLFEMHDARSCATVTVLSDIFI